MRKWIYINDEKSKYKISSKGYVVSTAYKGKNGVTRKLKHNHDTDGYCIITLNHRGKKYTFKIHRLVAEYFIPNPDGLPQVNHLDGNKDNNEDTNLEWSSGIDNIYHAWKNSLRKSTNSEDQIRNVCSMLQEGIYSTQEISDKTGVSRPDVIRVKNRERYTYISKDYIFSDTKLSYKKGSENPASKVNEQSVRIICELLTNGVTPTDISKRLNISRKIIYDIHSRKSWTDISDDYYFR